MNVLKAIGAAAIQRWAYIGGLTVQFWSGVGALPRMSRTFTPPINIRHSRKKLTQPYERPLGLARHRR